METDSKLKKKENEGINSENLFVLTMRSSHVFEVKASTIHMGISRPRCFACLTGFGLHDLFAMLENDKNDYWVSTERKLLCCEA